MSHDVWRRERWIALGLGAVGFGAGCRCSSEPDNVPAAPVPSAAVPDCVRSSLQLSFATSGNDGKAAPPLDPSVDLPFATEPGMAVALPSGFFATALQHEPRGGLALLGRVGADDALSQIVELGHVRGDVVPPRLAADGDALWVVVQEGTPAGRRLRIGRFASGDIGQAPTWRPGPEPSGTESSVFDIAAQAGVALLAYEDWSAAAHHGRILVAAIAATSATDVRIEGHAVSLPGVDAEAPRLAPRPGGYWLAWLVNAASAGAGRVYDPAEAVGDRATAGSAYNARWLSLVALDAEGKRIGDARRLTERQGRVVGYDLATSSSGSAWLAWRQDAPTPGASGGKIAVAEVRLDESPTVRSIREDDVGAGEPTWIVPGDEAARWLSFADARDRTVLLRVDSLASPGAPLSLGADLEGAGALAARGSELLFVVPRGRALELFPATCHAPARRLDEGVDAGIQLPPAVADAGAAPPLPRFRAP